MDTKLNTRDSALTEEKSFGVLRSSMLAVICKMQLDLPSYTQVFSGFASILPYN